MKHQEFWNMGERLETRELNRICGCERRWDKWKRWPEAEDGVSRDAIWWSRMISTGEGMASRQPRSLVSNIKTDDIDDNLYIRVCLFDILENNPTASQSSSLLFTSFLRKPQVSPGGSVSATQTLIILFDLYKLQNAFSCYCLRLLRHGFCSWSRSLCWGS